MFWVELVDLDGTVLFTSAYFTSETCRSQAR